MRLTGAREASCWLSAKLPTLRLPRTIDTPMASLCMRFVVRRSRLEIEECTSGSMTLDRESAELSRIVLINVQLYTDFDHVMIG
jgi:hypothetical protein